MQIAATELIVLLKKTSKRNGLRVQDVAELLCPGQGGSQTVWRQIRSVIKALRMMGWPICGHPSRGYYWAESAQDLEETIAFLRQRALSSLAQISILNRVAIPVLTGQMELPVLPLRLEPRQESYSQTAKERVALEIPQELLKELRQVAGDSPIDGLVVDALLSYLTGEHYDQKHD